MANRAGFSDECGVFGVCDSEDAANLAYLGLYALQHRGQESAGIASLDEGKIHVEREMGYVADVFDAARLTPAVDCLQLDVTRCGGYTGWLRCADLAKAAGLQVSAHCAPSLHAPVAAAVPWLRHVEWFVDHARLEPELVDGAPSVVAGLLDVPDSPGHGMTLRPDAERWRTD